MSLREKAKQVKNGNPIMTGREKISLDEIMAKFPNGVTLRECAIMHDTAKNSDYAVCVVDECKECFFFGGVAVLGLIENLMEDYDLEEAFHEELKAEGLPLLFSKKRSKNGRIYTSVTIL